MQKSVLVRSTEMPKIRRLYQWDEVPWVIGYSGGKDSSAVLQLVWLALKELPVEKRSKPVHVISTDSLAGDGFWGRSRRNIPVFSERVRIGFCHSSASDMCDVSQLRGELGDNQLIQADAFLFSLLGRAAWTDPRLSTRHCGYLPGIQRAEPR